MKKQILDYVYDIHENEEIQTYSIIKEENDSIQALESDRFYLSIYGDAFIQKLEGKGYISMDEAKEKYQTLDIPIKKKQKIKWKKKS